MRFERIPGLGPEAGFRLFDGYVHLGDIRDGVVSFRGFTNREDAAEAAHVAHRALEQRRAKAPWASEAAEGYQPAPDFAPDGWGFEVPLLPEEQSSVFAMSRARTMWQSLSWSGLSRRMRQFGAPAAASDDAGSLTPVAG